MEFVKFLQKIGFERIEAFADPENTASLKAMEKIGRRMREY